MKKLLAILAIFITTQSYAGLPEMMKVYNNPTTASKVAKCKGNTNCNAFVALANQWQDIPNNYRYHGFDIKKQAREGDGYGLNKGFTLYTDKSVEYDEAGSETFYWSGSSEALYGKGKAVLLYIEHKKGWVKD